MTIYDAALAVVLIGGMIRGAWRGITWQLASIGSLVLGYLFAYPISAQIAPLLPGPAETTRALSMAVAYAVVSGGVFFAAWMVRGTIHKLKFDAFDRHLGMMLGGVEGAGVGILLTLLIVSVSPNTREPIFASPSGRVVGSVMNTLGPVLPGEVRRILQPFWDAADGSNGQSVADSDEPAPAPAPESPAPAPVVAASVVQPVTPASTRDAAVRPVAGRGEETPALEAPAQPAQAGPRSVLDSIVDQGKQAVEQVVVESLDTDPDQKASTIRQLVDKDKKRIQNAVSDVVGGVKQNLTKQAQGRAGQVQGRVNQIQGQAVKARQKVEQKIGDTIDKTIDQQLDRLGGLQPAPEKKPQ
ncbi:MAG: CvpA family protein [Paludisphaera borealis]|uniref:CvpA family protein n=1 Tax=Paludisphaera borealis TaxID=1387353 RepID=UPI002845492E|nr:CvpA family protein [Paludisphaera borealis]MDR3622149.1 CvpA family protein [Paludisphaera borealis]